MESIQTFILNVVQLLSESTTDEDSGQALQPLARRPAAGYLEEVRCDVTKGTVCRVFLARGADDGRVCGGSGEHKENLHKWPFESAAAAATRPCHSDVVSTWKVETAASPSLRNDSLDPRVGDAVRAHLISLLSRQLLRTNTFILFSD